jgi:hypothetical protein
MTASPTQFGALMQMLATLSLAILSAGIRVAVLDVQLREEERMPGIPDPEALAVVHAA